MPKYEFKQVADLALTKIDQVLHRWLPGGTYSGAEYVPLNPIRDDKHKGSFSINRNTGAWADFADDKKGSDLVALIAYLEGVNQGEACRILAEFLGINEVTIGSSGSPKPGRQKNAKKAWMPIMPVPADTEKSCPRKHYKNGKPSAVWEYRDEAGLLLMKIMRFDIDSGGKRAKDYRPITYCKSNDGSTSWRWQQPDRDRPLYGLDRLDANPDAEVVFLEGEKAADSAVALFPGRVCMTWPGGGRALSKACFSTVSGRSVILWPDNDPAGRECMANLAELLGKIGCKVRLLNLDALGSNWPAKADAADALANGIDAEKIKHLEDSQNLFRQHEPSTDDARLPTDESYPGRQDLFVINDRGVYFRATDEEGESTLFRICDKLEIIAQTRDEFGREWGQLVRFRDPDNTLKDWNIPSQLLATEGGAEVLRQLYSLGLKVEAGQQPRRRLIQYIQSSKQEERYTLVNKLGWHGKAFLIPGQTIGKPKEPLYFYSNGPDLNKMDQRGTLDEWKNNISLYAKCNPWLIFAISAAFAAPLLHLMGVETIGFHFFGDSSQGKTTLLKVAASVYGPPEYMKTWRSTDNALESVASAHSDSLLILDEISQCDPRIIGDITYMLGNGKGKSRLSDRGYIRSNNYEWRLLFLSNGERSLQQHLAEAGKTSKAGQEVRLLSIPSDAGGELGVFNHLHDFSGGHAFSKFLVENSSLFYGTPFVEFVRQLCDSDHSKIATRARDEAINFISRLPPGTSSQVTRAAEKFAIVGFAGELATKVNITGWKKGEATAAAKACFDAWLAARGSSGNLEDQQALSQIKLLFEKFGESRFTRWDRQDSTADDHSIRTMERWGFRKTTEDKTFNHDEDFSESGAGYSEVTYYVTLEAFKAEICKGLNLKKVKTLLGECGALDRDSAGCYTVATRLPGAGKKPQRVYIVRPHMIPGSSE